MGGVGDVVSGQADIVAAPISMTAERYEVIDWLPVLSGPLTAIFVTNNPSEMVSWTLLVLPWRKDLWIALSITAIGLAILLTAFDIVYSAKLNKFLVSHEKLYINFEAN